MNNMKVRYVNNCSNPAENAVLLQLCQQIAQIIPLSEQAERLTDKTADVQLDYCAIKTALSTLYEAILAQVQNRPFYL